MADPGFVAVATANSGTDSVAELQITIPVAATAGDRLVLATSVGSGTASAAPAGFTLIGDTSASPNNPTASGGRTLIWAAEAGSQAEVDPGAVVTIPLTGSSRICAFIYVAGPSDVDDIVIGPTSTQGSTPPFTRATPAATASDLARALHLYGVNGNDSSNDQITWTPDAATTERADTNSQAPSFRNMTLMVADEPVSAGATTARTATASHRTQACAVVVVLSSAVNRPTATATTPTPTVAAGTTGVQLTGDASGGAGAPFTWAWTQTAGTAVTLSSATAQSPTFTAPPQSDELTFELVATDSGAVDSLPATVTVTVAGASDTALPVSDQVVTGWLTDPEEANTVAETLADNTDATFGYIEDPVGTAVLEVGLTPLQEPLAGEPVTIFARPSFVVASSGSITMILKEGASTVIATSGPHNWAVANTVQQFEYTLSPGEVSAITDWSNLRLRFEGSVA